MMIPFLVRATDSEDPRERRPVGWRGCAEKSAGTRPVSVGLKHLGPEGAGYDRRQHGKWWSKPKTLQPGEGVGGGIRKCAGGFNPKKREKNNASDASILRTVWHGL
jgi:hypothetical protein